MVKLPKLLASLSLTHFLCPLDKLPTSLEKVYLDVKTTKGDFNQPFHMSFSEVKFAASYRSYRIARVFNLGDISAQVCILNGISELSEKLLKNFSALPEMVAIDSISLVPSQFNIEIDSVIQILSQ